jgi:hypothetical protein
MGQKLASQSYPALLLPATTTKRLPPVKIDDGLVVGLLMGQG